MGTTKRIGQKLKTTEKKKQEDFNERLTAYVADIKEATTKHNITFRPYIGKYGAEVEFVDVPKQSNIIIPK